MALSLKEKIFIVIKYYENKKSTEIVQNEFSEMFSKCSTLPTNEMILNVVDCFVKYGSIRRIGCETKEKQVETKTEIEDPKSPVPAIVDDGNESDAESVMSVKQVRNLFSKIRRFHSSFHSFDSSLHHQTICPFNQELRTNSDETLERN